MDREVGVSVKISPPRSPDLPASRLVFILSLSTLLTAAIHRPDTLRGLSRWTLSFVMNGPNAGFWKRKRLDTNAPPTPRAPSPPKESGDIAENTDLA